MAYLEQTQRAIDAMLEAGFKRSEFSVQVKRHQRTIDGKRYTEYGRAEITLKIGFGKGMDQGRVTDMIGAVAEHSDLHVCVYHDRSAGKMDWLWRSTRVYYMHDGGGMTIRTFHDKGYDVETRYTNGKVVAYTVSNE